jgi:hypothetical protein
MPSAASVAASAPATQSSVALRNQKLRVALDEKIAKIRALMVSAAPRGFQQGVADLMDARKERISRELGEVQELSVRLVLAEVALHHAEGRPEHASRLIAALNEGEPVRLQTSGALVIRMRDGQMFLDLEGTRA